MPSSSRQGRLRPLPSNHGESRLTLGVCAKAYFLLAWLLSSCLSSVWVQHFLRSNCLPKSHIQVSEREPKRSCTSPQCHHVRSAYSRGFVPFKTETNDEGRIQQCQSFSIDSPKQAEHWTRKFQPTYRLHMITKIFNAVFVRILVGVET